MNSVPDLRSQTIHVPGPFRTTPGEWKAMDSSPMCIADENGSPLATMFFGLREAAEVRANAALMAEAPELRWAVQTLLAIVAEAQRGGDGDPRDTPPSHIPAWYDPDAVEYLTSEAQSILSRLSAQEAL